MVTSAADLIRGLRAADGRVEAAPYWSIERGDPSAWVSGSYICDAEYPNDPSGRCVDVDAYLVDMVDAVMRRENFTLTRSR